MNVLSVGEDWIENPETYESSFYKRTLDNDVYIFTAPSFNSKFVFSSWLCVHPWGSLSFSRPFGSGVDHFLWPLISLVLSFSCSRCVFSAIIPLPPRPPHFLLSALISLADISAENKKKKRNQPHLTGLTHVQAPQIAPRGLKSPAHNNDMKVISKIRQRLFSFTCNWLSDIFPAFPPRLQRRTRIPSPSPASWWAERWNSPSTKSRSNQQVSLANGRSAV